MIGGVWKCVAAGGTGRRLKALGRLETISFTAAVGFVSGETRDMALEPGSHGSVGYQRA